MTIPRPTVSTLFPYTTLFRSVVAIVVAAGLVTTGVRRGRSTLDERRGGTDVLAPPRPSTPTVEAPPVEAPVEAPPEPAAPDRKSTRLNSSHVENSYAVFCLKK